MTRVKPQLQETLSFSLAIRIHPPGEGIVPYGFHLRPVWVVLKKEFLDNVRNRWIIAISAIFIIMTLAVSYFGATQTGGVAGFQGFSGTLLGLGSIVWFLVPILGLMLSYGSVVGEKERGTIQLLLSMPITRLQTVLGKFLGLAAVVAVAIPSGLGIAGGVIMASVGTEGWDKYFTFLGGTVLLALAFVSVGFLLSTLARRRSTAVGLAVFLWFFLALIFDITLSGIYVATGGTLSLSPGGTWHFPDWLIVARLANPPDAFTYFLARVFGYTGGLGFTFIIPSFVTVGTTILSLSLWTVVPLLVSRWRFGKQDM